MKKCNLLCVVVWLSFPSFGQKAIAQNESAPIATSISINQTSLNLDIGDECQLTASCLDQIGNPMTVSLTWSSDNGSVATVDQFGAVFAVGEGTANITVSFGSLKNSAGITVNRLSIPGNPSPSIQITGVPPYGWFGNVSGKVIGVDPTKYNVAVLIDAWGGWWTKPYDDEPLTPIASDGTWSTTVTTGGLDENSVEVVAYLIPVGTSPVIVNTGSIPAWYGSYVYASYPRSSYTPDPIITPNGGTFASPQIVTMSYPYASAPLYYTIDGSTPGGVWEGISFGEEDYGIAYSQAIVVDSNTTIRAVAVSPAMSSLDGYILQDGVYNSQMAVAKFTINFWPVPEIISVPRYGYSGYVYGVAMGIQPADIKNYRVLTLVAVDYGWWTKPKGASPAVKIGANGYWTANITGADAAEATEIRVYLVPTGFDVLCEGSYDLPSSLDMYPYSDILRMPAPSDLRKIVVAPTLATLTTNSPPQPLSATGLDKNKQPVSTTFMWLSTNPKVAMVDQGGVVRPVARGIAVIHAISGNHTGTATIRVR